MTSHDKSIKELVRAAEFNRFFVDLLSMYKKCYDRDNTIMLAFQWESFEEFYEEYKVYFILKFNKFEDFFNAILKIYFKGQLACLLNEHTIKEIFDDFIEQAVLENSEKMIATVKKFHLKTYEDIERSHNNRAILYKPFL